jgi:lipoprotein-releasing system ATP-binding protein
MAVINVFELMGFIKIKALYKSYRNGRKSVDVLKGIDLDIDEGDTVAILGASGVGKSTFLNIVGALDRPTEGQIFYRDESIFDLDEKSLASFRNKKIGFVFQFHHLLPEFSALENIMLPALIGGGAYGEVRERAEGLLKEIGLGPRLEHKPGELSGGEQQRIAVLRAIIQMPELILADEPTGNLDSATGEEVFELLMSLNREKNITLVVATHNEALSVRLARRLRMVDGKVSEL